MMKIQAGWRFDNTFVRLPEVLFSRQPPVPVADPRLRILNRSLAVDLGLKVTALETPPGAAMFAGNLLPEGAEPIAQAYAGHQFGGFTMLGDGRASLLGEHVTPDGRRFDIQLKGSGRTPYSRGGDGRAALGPMLREYVISEALHALGVPTTRSLAVVTSGEPVFREMALPGAILTRVAGSHIRVGTFEYLAARGDLALLRTLADYTLERHFPELAETKARALALLEGVIDRQAALIAQWLQIGFIHGVMNTDNMALSGETIDFGPCAFMDSFDPATVFSSIDQHGRYAFGNQPRIAQWNLARFAETLLPLFDADIDKAVPLAEEAIAGFAPRFHRFWLAGMRRKIGLFTEEPEDDELVDQLLACLHQEQADFTNTFRDLGTLLASPAVGHSSASSLQVGPDVHHRRRARPGSRTENPDARIPMGNGLARPIGGEANSTAMPSGPAFTRWLSRWRDRLDRQQRSPAEVIELMHKNNPAFIPRNHRVQAALTEASQQGHDAAIHRLLAILANPYDDQPEHAEFRRPPNPDERITQTFCGT
jgi:serine/tyrosine/threonine adenylyltransferase